MSAEQSRLSRRALLQRSVGAAVLVAAPELFSAKRAAAAAGLAGAVTAGRPFYLYGIPDPTDVPGPSVHAGEAGSGSPKALATELAALPVKSPDGTKLALVALQEHGAVAGLAVTVVDVASAAVVSSGTLTMSELPDAMLLATPVFAADSSTVAVVLSVTEPTNWQTLPKLNPLTGETRTIRTATWVSHHALVYFDSRSKSFAGPFQLSDAPSLARVSATADDRDLFLWTIKEPAAVRGTKENPLPAPVPQLSAFPLGSGKARFTVQASDVWPVNSEPILQVGTGMIARLVYGRQVEIYGPKSGSHTTVTIGPLDQGSAKSAFTTMELRPDGLVYMSNPVIGKAVVADPSRSFKVVSAVSYAAPGGAGGAPSSKAALSADGKTLYALGGGQAGGLSAYDASTGAVRASHADGKQYTAVYELSGGTILAVSADNPRLSFFSASLDPISTTDSSLNVVEVY
jgi:hypothetical protein